MTDNYKALRDAIEEYGRTMYSAGMDAASNFADRQFDAQSKEDEAGEMLRALRAELDALREDAERYRWLCDKFGVTKLPCSIERILGGGYIADGKDSIDAAIDAARKEPHG